MSRIIFKHSKGDKRVTAEVENHVGASCDTAVTRLVAKLGLIVTEALDKKPEYYQEETVSELDKIR